MILPLSRLFSPGRKPAGVPVRQDGPLQTGWNSVDLCLYGIPERGVHAPRPFVRLPGSLIVDVS